MSDRAPQQQVSAPPVSAPAQSPALPTQSPSAAEAPYLDYSVPIQAKMRPFGGRPVDSPFAKPSHPLAPRPFIVPNPARATPPSVQAQLKHAQTFGNHLVPTLPSHPIQTKLTVGAPGDRYEQEADRVAEQVMSMPDPTPPVQRATSAGEEDEMQMKAMAISSVDSASLQQQCSECEQKPQVQRVFRKASLTPDGIVQAQPDLESRLNTSKGGGEPLSEDVQLFMEPRFGADFSGVRVHTDSAAVQMNQDLNAQAFTHQQDIYYGAGKAPAKDA